MPLSAATEMFLESEIFKGKIAGRRKGRGGLIYIIERHAFPKRVAYKTIQEFEDNLPADTMRIEREARNWFRFASHPLTIKPYSVTQLDGFPLICMPYCDGDLSALVEKRLSLTAVVCLALQIVKGMLVANARGMDYHQDIKPENLLYVDLSKEFPGFPSPHVDPSAAYSVRIADFGVANAWHNKHPGGTNVYRAPEQYDTRRYTMFAPDIFATGLVIAELLQGYHPASPEGKVNVRNWSSSRLKTWSIEGKRHFISDDNPHTQKLVGLLKEMLTPDPASRPSFQSCYDQLAALLQQLNAATLTQMDLLFEYFDYISNYCSLEDELHRLKSLAGIPAERTGVITGLSAQLKSALQKDEVTLQEALHIHHVAGAFHELTREGATTEQKELLIKASRAVVEYVLRHHDLITSSCLWPSFSFLEKATKQTSDLEAKADLLDVNIGRLNSLGAFDEQLRSRVEQGGDVIKACRIYGEASRLWQSGQGSAACTLLAQVRRLVQPEPELDELYDGWMRSTERWEYLSTLNL